MPKRGMSHEEKRAVVLKLFEEGSDGNGKPEASSVLCSLLDLCYVNVHKTKTFLVFTIQVFNLKELEKLAPKKGW